MLISFIFFICLTKQASMTSLIQTGNSSFRAVPPKARLLIPPFLPTIMKCIP